jgi:hypothetical protein
MMMPTAARLSASDSAIRSVIRSFRTNTPSSADQIGMV